MAMLALFSTCLFLEVSSGLSFPEQDIPNFIDKDEFSDVTPDVLDALLKDNQLELFSKLLKIDVNLVRPSERERTLNPMFHKDLEFGDMLLPKEYQEQSRQGIRMDKYWGNKWPNREMPYALSKEFSEEEVKKILSAIEVWNKKVNCLKIVPRNGQKDYVMVFNGDGSMKEHGFN